MTAFRSVYLKKHLYGNASTSDLWDGISSVSGVDVADLMDNWTKKVCTLIFEASFESGCLTG